MLSLLPLIALGSVKLCTYFDLTGGLVEDCSGNVNTGNCTEVYDLVAALAAALATAAALAQPAAALAQPAAALAQPTAALAQPAAVVAALATTAAACSR